MTVCRLWKVLCAWVLAGTLIGSPLTSAAQMGVQAAPTQGPAIPQPLQGGSATGGVFAPVYDSQNRPITAGGFVKDGPIIFQDPVPAILMFITNSVSSSLNAEVLKKQLAVWRKPLL